jgi:hypothetical protein
MRHSPPASTLRFHQGQTIKRGAALSVAAALLFSAVSQNVAMASNIRGQNPTVSKLTSTKTVASSAGYAFDLYVDMATDGEQPSRTSFRGRASLAELDSTLSRIQIHAIAMAQTDNGGVVRPVELSESFRVALNEPFDVNTDGTPTLLVGQTEPEEVTNIKRSLAKQIALTPNEDQTLAGQLAIIRSDITDGFGTYKNRSSLTRAKGRVVLKENRTEADYTRLAIPGSLNPEVDVVNTNVYNQSTGLLESSQTFEAVTVDYGSLPQSAQNPTVEGRQIAQSASSRMSVSRTGQGEPLDVPGAQRRVVSVDTTVTDDMKQNARKASAPTFDEAMAAVNSDPEAPSSALGLAARLQSDPQAMITLRKTLEAGTVSPQLLPAVASALIETNTPEAQSILVTSVLGRNDLSAEQRQHLALSIASVDNPTPGLLAAIRSAKNNELLSTDVRRPNRPDPTECELDPTCIPGGGGQTGPPPLMTFPYAKTWNQRIGNAALGADIGAAISITRNPNSTNDFNSDVNAYAKGLVLAQQFSVVDANLKTITDPSGNRRVEASIDVRGRGRETFTTGTGCLVDLEGNLYEGTLPFFATSFWIPVGPVVFYGGASAAGHVSVPWGVSARTCGSNGYAIGSFSPNVYVEVRAYGGISIFIASAGLEAIGTIADLTMTPSARIRWNPAVSPDAGARFSLEIAFRPFALKVRAWLRVLFWTKRWTLAEWRTPLRVWTAAWAQTANWGLFVLPEILGPPPVVEIKASDPSIAQSTKPSTSGAKPISAQSITAATTVPSTTTAPVASGGPSTTSAPTTTPATADTTPTKPTVPADTTPTKPTVPADTTPRDTKPTTPAPSDTKPTSPTTTKGPETKPTVTTTTTPPTTTSPAGARPAPVRKPVQRATDSIGAVVETDPKEAKE